MSITLTAYPAAFLISPDKAKSEQLKEISESFEDSTAIKNMRYIRVLTNLRPVDLKRYMVYVDGCKCVSPETYEFSNGLCVRWNFNQMNCEALLSGCENSKQLQQYGEEFFNKLDAIVGENVRLLNSCEYFYYNYETEYTDVENIQKTLEKQRAKNIYTESSSQISANVDGNNVRYYREAMDTNFTLEVEQKIIIQNIGFDSSVNNGNFAVSPLKSLKINTNIQGKELRKLLREAGLGYYIGNSQTPLKTYNATLNWILQNGTYIAEFCGPNIKAIEKEAEEIFKKMNIAAKRDLRYINEFSQVTYSYNTNYTDKGILLNTLTEHGASNITESEDKISCDLFGMGMVYTKKDGDSSYTLEITRVSSKEECMDLINNLNSEYGLNTQEMTYNKIKERLAQENMRLEDETILEDNSIVLTIDIG